MKKIISFSLWGDKPTYTVGAIENAKLAETLFNDWICRFYVGTSVPSEIISELRIRKNVEVIEMLCEGDWTSMFWRFEAASDSDVDIVLSRDTDSRLSLRERFAVDEWLKSDKDFHIMRDHPYHQTAILGGMWGVRNKLLSNMKELISEYTKGNFWQVDQNFLTDKIYPIVKDKSYVHDEFFGGNKFPSPRQNRFFIGQAFDENNKPLYVEHMNLLP